MLVTLLLVVASVAATARELQAAANVAARIPTTGPKYKDDEVRGWGQACMPILP